MMNQPQGTPANVIASEQIASEPKRFFLDLKENQRGRFMQITEDTNGKRARIMVPAAAFKEFVESLERLTEFEAQLPS